MICSVCKVLAEHPEALCFIVDVSEDVCVNHIPPADREVFIARDYLELNSWAANLDAGVYWYKVMS